MSGSCEWSDEESSSGGYFEQPGGAHLTSVPRAAFWTQLRDGFADAIQYNIPDSEYEMLAEESGLPKEKFTASRLEFNKGKNRYQNILPYDHTRVRLEEQEGIPGSDYINANFMGSDRDFIASQAPTPATFGDFWRMIFQCRIPAVLMLTRHKEGTRVKSHQYWPEVGDTEQYDDMSVELVVEEEEGELTMRQFLVYSPEGEQVSTTQFHLTSWPDHGVPADSDEILRLLLRVDEMASSPILVHCSAGIGRTGAFILMLQKYRELKHSYNNPDEEGNVEMPTVSMMDLLRQMRGQRYGMCQNAAQYRFCYKTLHQLLVERAGQPDPSN